MFSVHDSHTPIGSAEKPIFRKAIVLGALLLTAAIVGSVSYSRSGKPATQSDFEREGVTYTCSAGMYIHTDGCLYCPAGNKCANEDTQNPTQCLIGTYQPNTGKLKCLVADVGNFAAGLGAIGQKQCPKGKFQAYPGKGGCDDARPGHFVDHLGAVQDEPCTKDTFQDLSGQESCKPCPAGQHQPFTGQKECMANGNVPWASLVAFTSLDTLRVVITRHGCPDGLYTKEGRGDPQTWSMVESNACEITANSIILRAYGGNSEFIATNVLTITKTGITCAGTRIEWGQTNKANWDCRGWGHFTNVKLIYSTGVASRTFQSMVDKKTTMAEALRAGYAAAIEIKFADGRVLVMDSYQQTGAPGGNHVYRLARWWHDAAGNQMHIEINGFDACIYCDMPVGQKRECQLGKNKGDTVNSRVFKTTFICGAGVLVRI